MILYKASSTSMQPTRIRTALSAALIVLALLPPGLSGQQPGVPRPGGPLRIYVLQGDNVINNTATRMATAPVIEVRDANDFPVAGATVTFELPSSGPGASFEGGRLQYSSVTGSRGQATAAAMTPNDIEGLFSIRVTARLDDLTGVAVIRQTNSGSEFSAFAPPSEKPSFWRRNRWWLIGAGIGGAAGLTYFFVNRSSKSGAVLRPGTVVIGGPR